MTVQLLLDETKLAALRAAVRDGGEAVRLAAALADHVAPLVEAIRAERNLPEALRQWDRQRQLPVSAAIRMLHDLALHAVVADDGGARAAVTRVLAALPEAEGRGEQGGRWRVGRSIPLYLPAAFDLVADEMDAGQRRAVVRWLIERCIRPSLEEAGDGFFDFAGANIPLRGVVVACSALAAAWRHGARDELPREAERLELRLQAAVMGALGPSGYPVEDIGYGTLVGARLVWVADVAERVMGWHVFKACPRLLHFGRAVAAFTFGEGRLLFNTGDNAAVFLDREAALLPLYERTGDGLHLWLLRNLGGQAEGADISARLAPCPPELRVGPGQSVPISAHTLARWRSALAPPPATEELPRDLNVYRDATRGIVSFREGWGAHAAAAVVDGSHRPSTAQGHAQASGGHFSFCAAGELFAIDTGRYGVDQSDHNVVLVDGHSAFGNGGEWTFSRRHGRLVGIRGGAWCSVAEVDAAALYGARWARRWVALVQGRPGPGYLVVIDDLNMDDAEHDYWWTLNTSPENRVQVPENAAENGVFARATIVGCREGHTLDAAFVGAWSRPSAIRLSADQATTAVDKYLPDLEERIAREPAPRLTAHFATLRRPRLVAAVKTIRLRMMSVLTPRFHGEPPVVVEALPTIPGTVAARVQRGGARDTLVWSFDSGMIEADDVSARGDWVVARVVDGEDVAWLGPVESLSIAGRRMDVRRVAPDER